MRTAAAATALGITLSIAALASCASPGPDMPRPSPSVTPVFASEEEALAAAEEAYQRYLDVLNSVGQSGWTQTSGLSEVARADALETALKNAADFAAKGWVQVGSGTYDSMVLQQLDDSVPGAVEITSYVCLVVSNVDVVDATGSSVVSPSRPARQPFEVTLDDSESKLKVSRSESWPGANFC